MASKVTVDLYGDLLTRKLADSQGAALTLPPLVLGDSLECRQHFLEHLTAGVRETNVNVRAIHASFGATMAPPTAGAFSLQYASLAAVGPFDLTTTADALKVALHAAFLAGTVPHDCLEAVLSTAGCWLLRFGYTGAFVLAPSGNTLAPESFVRWRGYFESGAWWHELRLIQTPLAFANSFERVLPPAPAVAEIQSGAPAQPALPALNEIQALTVDSTFRGTFFLRWNLRRSTVLSETSTPDDMAFALNAMFSDGGTRFRVTNPAPSKAYIEFVGELGALPQPLITVEVDSFPPGIVTFSLPLDKAVLATALRAAPTVTGNLEVEIAYVDDGDDPADLSIPSKIATLYQYGVTVAREQIYAELAVVVDIDWLRPPQPVNYIPFTPDQVITGSQYYTAAFGDGAALVYTFAHNLGTSAGLVSVRENVANGRELVHGGEYAVVFVNANSLTITCASAPSAGGLALLLATAGPKSAFQAHTHTIGQIVGLQAALDSLTARVTTIEDRLPFSTPSTPSAAGTGITIALPPRYETFPGVFNGAEASGQAPATPRKIAALLPALHVASTTALPGPPPAAADSAVSGKVLVNSGSDPVALPGGLGHRGFTLAVSGKAASDGRLYYPVRGVSGKTSYYPTEFERELFRLPVSSKQLRPGGVLTGLFTLALQMVAANTCAQYLLVVECGTAPQDTSPATTAPNLKDIEWNATPIFAERIVITPLLVTANFGFSILHALDNSFSANALLYTAWEAANAGIPTAIDFVLRAKLVEFDTEDVPDPRGAVFYSFTSGLVTIA